MKTTVLMDWGRIDLTDCSDEASRALFQYKDTLPDMRISIVKIRRSWYRLISYNGNSQTSRTALLYWGGPWFLNRTDEASCSCLSLVLWLILPKLRDQEDLSLPLLITSYHYSDVMVNAMAFQITGVFIVCSIICSGGDTKNQSYASEAFVGGIHGSPVDSPHKGQ